MTHRPPTGVAAPRRTAPGTAPPTPDTGHAPTPRQGASPARRPGRPGPIHPDSATAKEPDPVKPLTHAELLALPPVIDVPTAGRAFGLGRTFAYELARQDKFPCPVHRHGRLYRVNTSDIMAALGLHRT